MSALGQGGVKLGHNVIDGAVPRNMSGGVMEEEPHDNVITHNVIEDIGLILKVKAAPPIRTGNPRQTDRPLICADL